MAALTVRMFGHEMEVSGASQFRMIFDTDWRQLDGGLNFERALDSISLKTLLTGRKDASSME